MNEDRVDRIRYNVNIQHSRTGAGNGLTSPAIFSESLARPLINKFKIDTFTIPITIVKLKEYQPVRTDGKFFTDYWVQLIDAGGYVHTAPCMYKPEQQLNTCAPVQDTRPSGDIKYDNTSEVFFVYSYQHILDMINEAIEEVCAEGGIESAPFFTYDSRTQLISVCSIQLSLISLVWKRLLYSVSLPILRSLWGRASDARDQAKNGSITSWSQTLIRLLLSI